jgi:regulator of protease activity HflC (stomatin/prohibitin superfamily)
MKKINFNFFLGLILVSLMAMSCGRVQPGEAGVKVKTLGQNKGIEPIALDVGRYWMGVQYDLYTYPTFVNLYPFTKAESDGSPYDESFYFQSREGITCSVDLTISCYADYDKVVTLFKTYRKDMMEIIKINLRQDVNNYFVDYASDLTVEEIYSTEKMNMLNFADSCLRAKVEPNGIVIEDISYKSDIRFPEEVQKAIIGKIQAVQLATQKQNEIMQEKADAEKARMKAAGVADALLIEARAQAEANQILARSITPTLVNYQLAITWNGVSPIYSGNGSVIPPLFPTK